MSDESDNSAWRQAIVSAGQAKELNKLLLAIIATDRNGQLHLIGSSCVIVAAGREALAVTAKHNFDEAQRLQQPPDASHPSISPLFRPDPKPLDISPECLRALYFEGENVDACEITAYQALPQLDIAFFSVRFQEHYEGPPFEVIAHLDSRPLMYGEHVAALALDGLDVEQEFLGAKSWKAQIARAIDLRRGTVTNSYFVGGRSPWPAAESTIPIKGGMSGGPVFRLNQDGSLVQGVCGILSKDLSEASAFESFLYRGHSTIAMIYPSFITPV
jgi:hypothetical protein